MENLPKDWYIEVTNENLQELESWRKSVTHLYPNRMMSGDTLVSQHHQDGSYYYSGKIEEIASNKFYSNYKQITLDQFRQITNLNKNMKQTLTRAELLSLYNKSECSEWKNEIKQILTNEVLNNGDITIPQKSLDLLITNGSDVQKLYVTDLGITLPKSPKEQYIENQKNCGLKVGDKVRVTRIAKDNEDGWGLQWDYKMDDTVDRISQIISHNEDDDEGFKLENYFYYPYFVLEKVEEKYVPYTFEDDLLGMKVISKDKLLKCIITQQSSTRISMGKDCDITYDYLFQNCTKLDGSPCGNLIVE